MRDALGREINYIRISVTDRCNLRCGYCIPKEGVRLCTHENLLCFDEIERLVRIFAGLGIDRVKLTGGEPFVRRDFPKLAQKIKEVDGIKKLTVTTNGTFFTRENAEWALECFDGINISLDTPDRGVYEEMTGVDVFDNVYDGLQRLLFLNAGRDPGTLLKLNCVLTRKNKDDITALAGLAKEQKLAVRFIELMPIGQGKIFLENGKGVLQEAEAVKLLEEAYGKLIPCEENSGNGPAVYYRPEGFCGKIGFISALSHKFCETCNRIRLTTTGYLKLCLQYETGIDLKTLLRNGASDEEIRAVVLQTIKEKPAGHAFCSGKIVQEENRGMSEIGG
ncbi:MAG TPA: GTP 3',8-cyclase MoaA [Lachnospiraceae bacterium]|nr:GTP 3',8-cyclase MoaA [Lachnospiraceae bacterium]